MAVNDESTFAYMGNDIAAAFGDKHDIQTA